MGTLKIRVENLPGVQVSHYARAGADQLAVRPFRLLFIKPYQEIQANAYGPPLGILTLAACLRERLGDRISIDFWDMKVYNDKPTVLRDRLDALRPDVVAVSALNFEAAASYEIARIAKDWNPDTLTVIGGPFALRQTRLIFEESEFDWVFEGAADRTFPDALERRFAGLALGDDIPGFSYRGADGQLVCNEKQDLITDLDSIPMPAWDLLDFARYQKPDRPGIILGDQKYAYLFTSRGCPYLCNYCHDIFTKRFIYQSDERVLEEIRILHETYGITEFHFIDDIFNLHRPRVQSIMRAVAERWPGKLRFAYPNGLRGDILDSETISAMVDAGCYHATIAIETVTPRLQQLVEKKLDIDKAKWAIEEFHRRGVIVQGSFMVGFPTETVEEIEATVSYAIGSPLTHAYFFAVVPQPSTPIYALAMQESAAATEGFSRDERSSDLYMAATPWYSRAYGYDLHRRITVSYARFYLHPRRMLTILRLYSPILVVRGSLFVFRQALRLGARLFLRALGATGRKAPLSGDPGETRRDGQSSPVVYDKN